MAAPSAWLKSRFIFLDPLHAASESRKDRGKIIDTERPEVGIGAKGMIHRATERGGADGARCGRAGRICTRTVSVLTG